KPNYQFEKRKKDLERKKKQDEKRQKKAEKAQGKAPGDEFGEPQTPMPSDGNDGTDGGAPAV
ncbi:MAG: hypothetical protein ABUL63_04005, partial [Acidobacteriota bacterium]